MLAFRIVRKVKNVDFAYVFTSAMSGIVSSHQLEQSVLFVNFKKFLIFFFFFKDADEKKNWSHFLLQLSNKVIVVGKCEQEDKNMEKKYYDLITKNQVVITN